MKKIATRMHRINSYIQMHGSFLVILATFLVILVSEAINFDTENTS